jgi:hypothetical protein
VTPQDDSGRCPLELGRLTFVGGAGFDTLAQYGVRQCWTPADRQEISKGSASLPSLLIIAEL